MNSKIELCNELQSSLKDFRNGTELQNNKDYLGAYNAFKSVSSKDVKRFVVAKGKISECFNSYSRDVFLQAKDLAIKLDYQGAIDDVNLVLSIDSNNENAKVLNIVWDNCSSKVIKEVKGDTDNIVDQTNIKRKTHFVMKKIFIFPILGAVLFILYYIGLQFTNNNGYELVGIYSYLRYLIPVISFILICPLIIMVIKNIKIIKNIKGIYKNQKKIEPENVVREEIDQATKIAV
ncbi:MULTISPECIES: hypothetical protein [Clostridium]|uniref:Uncharacterized protein n=1 Tax=Clostridium frigoriphilum TaxID=443253 RepID=A0ABU7UV80_9CLOT|nr:hypothetical protein [Clostridium sp. DSM 17811]MBU3101715.1 hypothetical protein [Clostridium sp. DSM 17811]